MLRFIIIFSTLWLATSAMASTMDDDASRELVNKLNTIQSAHAEFKQVTLDNRGGVLQQTQGAMWVKRPHAFRWAVKDPYEHIIWSNATDVWMYDVDLEQVVHSAVASHAGNAPSLLLSGNPQSIATNFTVEKAMERGEQSQFDLTPKDEEALFQQLSVVFKDNAIFQIELIDNLGQRTAIRFQSFEANATIDGSIFTPDFPDSVDVIDNHAIDNQAIDNRAT